MYNKNNGSTEKHGWWGQHLPEILGQTDSVTSEMPIFELSICTMRWDLPAPTYQSL